MARLSNLVGQRFGRLIVVAMHPKRRRKPNGASVVLWECRCDCSALTLVTTANLTARNPNKAIHSCGCLTGGRTVHGFARRNAKTPEYNTWNGMKDRCLNPKSAYFQHYGGRGIKVCDEWRDDFEAFLAHVGPRPSCAHSIDRINNNGNYEPGNVRWATMSEQALNRRKREPGYHRRSEKWKRAAALAVEQYKDRTIPVTAIARQHEVSTSAVIRWAVEAGLPLRKPHKPGIFRKKEKSNG